jgi:hypothetical protein
MKIELRLRQHPRTAAAVFYKSMPEVGPPAARTSSRREKSPLATWAAVQQLLTWLRAGDSLVV